MLRIATHGNGAYQRKLASIPTSVESEEVVPSNFILKQNYPNPFNPSTTIEYNLVKPSKVNLIIYNEIGQKVESIINNEWKSAGVHQIKWQPNGLASGVYFYNLNSGSYSRTRKMIYMK